MFMTNLLGAKVKLKDRKQEKSVMKAGKAVKEEEVTPGAEGSVVAVWQSPQGFGLVMVIATPQGTLVDCHSGDVASVQVVSSPEKASGDRPGK